MAFTKCPSVLYQNFLREFWCTAIAYDPNPSTDENKPRPLKEFLIKFTIMNGKKTLTLDFNTFTTSTGLDYNNDAYVAHPSPKAVKAELAKSVTNPSYLDKTLVLKNSFPVAWRILLTFVIQVLGGNYSSTEQVNSMQQIITYNLITGTKVDIREIITDETFGYLSGILSNSNFSKDPSKVTEIELTAHMIAVNNQKDSVSPLPLSAKKKKGKTQTMTLTLPKPSYEGESDIKALQLKTFSDVQVLLLSDDEIVQESDEEEVFAAREDMDEDTQADTEFQSPPPNTDKPESSPVQDTDESTSDSSPDLKKFDNILPLTERQLVKYLRKAAIEGYYEENINHKEQTDKVIDAAINSLDKNSIARGDLLNALNEVTKALKAIQDVVKEDHVLNKKVLEATKAYTQNSTHVTKLLTLIKNFDFQGLKSSVESLQAIALTQEEHLASWEKSSTSMAWNLGPRMTVVESSQGEIRSKISSLRKENSDIKSMITEIYQSFKGQSSASLSSMPQTTLDITEGPANVRGENVTQADTKEPPSHTEGEHAAIEEEPTNAVPITTVKPTEIPTPELTNEQIQAHLDKEEKFKKAVEEAKMFEMKKTEVIKVVQEDAEKIGLDPKKIISAKAGEKFKKAQHVEHQVLKREHSQKAKRAMELRIKRVEQYMWTMSNRLKPEPITDVKIHPNTKPAVLTVFKNNDKRNFEVHNLFNFGHFGITELDELVPGQAASQSSGRKRKHIELEPEIKVPWLECNISVPDGVPFVKNMVIEEPEYGIFFTDVFGDQAFQRWNYIHKVGGDSLVSYLVMALMVKTQENAKFGLKLRKLIADHPNQEKLQSKKVKLEALGYKLDYVLFLSLSEQSLVSYLQDAQPESTRKILTFSEAVLSE
ncbi:hypothetical protein Tco_1437641 [Tanacetum coccineum]